MGFIELFEWWNLIFVLPFTAALGYVLLLATGTVTAEHDVGIDHDAEFDHGFDFDHDVDLEHDVSVEHDFDHDVGHDHDVGDHEPGMVLKALSFLGLGKVPASIIFTCFCFVWGFTGWASNMIFGDIWNSPGVFIWPSLGIAGVSSVFLTKSIAIGFARILPSTETYAVSNRQLVGRRAEATVGITTKFGRARLRDQYGNIHEVTCLVEPDQPRIASGDAVVLMKYDEDNKTFIVRPDPLTGRRLPS